MPAFAGMTKSNGLRVAVARKWRRKPLKSLETRPEMAPAALPRFAARPSPAYISVALENRFGEPD